MLGKVGMEARTLVRFGPYGIPVGVEETSENQLCVVFIKRASSGTKWHPLLPVFLCNRCIIIDQALSKHQILKYSFHSQAGSCIFYFFLENGFLNPDYSHYS